MPAWAMAVCQCPVRLCVSLEQAEAEAGPADLLAFIQRRLPMTE